MLHACQKYSFRNCVDRNKHRNRGHGNFEFPLETPSSASTSYFRQILNPEPTLRSANCVLSAGRLGSHVMWNRWGEGRSQRATASRSLEALPCQRRMDRLDIILVVWTLPLERWFAIYTVLFRLCDFLNVYNKAIDIRAWHFYYPGMTLSGHDFLRALIGQTPYLLVHLNPFSNTQICICFSMVINAAIWPLRLRHGYGTLRESIRRPTTIDRPKHPIWSQTTYTGTSWPVPYATFLTLDCIGRG